MPIGPLIRGDHWKFTFTIQTPAGAVADITGGKIFLTFKSTDVVGQPDTNAEFQLKDENIQDVNDPENDVVNGKVVLRAKWDGAAVSPPDSSLVAPGRYSYDAQYVSAAGEITTVEQSTVEVIQDTTESR